MIAESARFFSNYTGHIKSHIMNYVTSKVFLGATSYIYVYCILVNVLICIDVIFNKVYDYYCHVCLYYFYMLS